MLALATATWTQNFCGNYAVSKSFADELVALATEKGAAWWKPIGSLMQSDVLSTPEQKCISWPEQKYISDAGNKAPELGAFS